MKILLILLSVNINKIRVQFTLLAINVTNHDYFLLRTLRQREYDNDYIIIF